MRPDELTAYVRARVRRGEHILAAVSGGADSVALLCILSDIARGGYIKLSAAHYEHGIRGGESIGDMEYVKELCGKLGVRLYTGSGDVPGEAARLRKGLEETARDMRRAFLRDVLANAQADCAALAHHADDQAETVLMRLFRGTGGSGAAGMRERQDVWFRPLLGIRRDTLREYLKEKGVAWREDSTNSDEFTPRNRLRLRVMPECEAIWPGAVEAVVRYSRLQAQDSDFIDGEAVKWLRANAVSYGFCVKCSAGDMPHRAVATAAFKRICGKDAAYADIIRVLEICSSGSGTAAIRSERFGYARVIADDVWFYNDAERADEIKLKEGANILPGIGTMTLGPSDGSICYDDVNVQTLRADRLENAVMRIWRSGDRIKPFGMHGKSRLISDVLSGRKIPVPLRHAVPVVEAEDGEILWAAGGCISESAALRPGDRALRLEWKLNTYNDIF